MSGRGGTPVELSLVLVLAVAVIAGIMAWKMLGYLQTASVSTVTVWWAPVVIFVLPVLAVLGVVVFIWMAD
jgi:hypothetical protein